MQQEEEEPFDFPALFPDTQGEVVKHLQMYEKQALGMTCRAYGHQWRIKDMEGLEKINDPYFLARYADKRMLEWSMEYFSLLRTLVQRNLSDPFRTHWYQEQFLLGLCVRGDTVLFVRLMSTFLPLGYQADPQQVFRFCTPAYRSNNRTIIDCFLDLGILSRFHMSFAYSTRLRLLLQPPPDVAPNIDLLLDCLIGLQGHTVIPERLLLEFCIDLKCIPTLLACCQKNVALKKYYQEHPAWWQQAFDKYYEQKDARRGGYGGTSPGDILEWLDFLQSIVDFRSLCWIDVDADRIALINILLEPYHPPPSTLAEEDLAAYCHALLPIHPQLRREELNTVD